MTSTAPAVPAPPQSPPQGATLVQHFLRQVATRPAAPSMRFMAAGRWVTITWEQFGAASRRIAAYLAEEGVAEQEHVAIWSNNRPEWHVADAAILSLRCRPVPVYLTLSAEQAGYVLAHSEATVAFVENVALLERVQSVRESLPALRRVVVIDGLDSATPDGFAIPWAAALQGGQQVLAQRGAELDRRAASVSLDDVATLIYTSGTTGPPKAVMLTHANCAAATASTAKFIHADENDRALSYLPLAHIAERNVSEFRSYVYGNVVYFAQSIDRLGEHMRDVRPTQFFAVPRIWEKMAASIRAQVAAATGMRGRLLRWAVRVGEQRSDARQNGRPVSAGLSRRHALADRLVLSKLRVAVGLDQATVLASGAAPIAPDVLRLFDAVGLEIDEVYGMTENTGLCTMNRPGQARFGTVGPSVPDSELRIAEDGEILCRSRMVFAGYHKDPEATRATMTEDGWLMTGDVGEVDAAGFLRITDRKKDLIITAGGKNIAPSNIETALKRHSLVANAVVIGDRRPYVTALITLDDEAVAAFARAQGVGADSPLVREEVQRHVDEVNAQLSHVEQVKRWALLPHDFEVGVELTPTLKVKRKVVAERYQPEIEQLYA
ncbi:MAG TPA: long-chain fatty acid--CoA ligase [Candidatus Angelobacter sp.]|nr:long-chain fatty acid--CoA ligase [Candidatus Angelobacter sp.]